MGGRIAAATAALLLLLIVAPAAGASGDRWAERTLREMSLREKVGQLFVATVWGKRAGEAHPTNRERYGVDTPAQVVRRYRVGGVIYFNSAKTDNVEDPTQVARFSNGLQRAAKVPLAISIDQEGGRVIRVEAPATELPAAMGIGATRDPRAARTAATITGRELRAIGINQDFAPVADVNTEPLNPAIGARSFSDRPALAGELARAAIGGFQRSGPPRRTVAAAAKHFPGHGAAATDSHTGLPEIERSEAEWRRFDLPPFRAAVRSGIDAVMTAHITVPSLDPSGEPATLSRPILTGLLRRELGFDGMVVTDALDMDGVRKLHSDAEIPVLALKAGADQMLMPPKLGEAIDAVLAAVKRGELSERRIDQSVRRILAIKQRRAIPRHRYVDPAAVARRVGTPAHRAAAQRIADRSVTVLRNAILPLRAKPASILVTGWDDGKAGAALTAALGRRVPSTTALPTGVQPTDAQIAAAADAATRAGLTVVLTNEIAANPTQRTLLERLRATGRPVVAVAAHSPYDAGFAPDMATWVATFGFRANSMESLARTLFGELRPSGRLPVDVPRDGVPAHGVPFAFGTGLTW